MAPKKAKEGAVEKPKRAPKAKKDPDAPKRASGAYIWFCQEKRPGVKEKNPSWGIGEIGKELGAEWKSLSDEQKKPYNALADKDKERWVKESAAYNKKNPAASKAEKEKPQKEKPKKAAKPAKKPPAKIASDDDDDDDEGDEDDDDMAEEDEDDE